MAKISSVTIKQGTTPVITATIDEAIQDATVYVSIRTRDRLIVKSNYNDTGEVVLEPIIDEDTDEQVGTAITIQLSQLETLCLKPGAARIEAGWVFEDGSADRSNIGMMTITPTLFKGVMRYGEHTS